MDLKKTEYEGNPNFFNCFYPFKKIKWLDGFPESHTSFDTMTCMAATANKCVEILVIWSILLNVPNSVFLREKSMQWSRAWTTRPYRLCQAVMFLGVRLTANIESIRRKTSRDGHPSRYHSFFLTLQYPSYV